MSFGLTLNDVKRIAYSALFAFLGVFLPLATGFSKYPNFATLKAAAVALIPAAVAAALSAIKNGVLADGSKFKG